jgi:5-methylcytosine-specific restriction endonuclease McrA
MEAGVKPCAVPGCPEPAVERGRCAAHQKKRRPKRTRPNYNTAAHRKWAQLVKVRDPYCVDPYDRHPNEQRLSQIADHIVPVREGGDYSMENGRGVCWSCHEYGKATQRGA